ncbi:MAG: DegT/DnrJ/EryC1/StrS family aminotransferase [Caldilineales bacterium]|nr:DegT/DnrJ/EryC1/StrS family aminotransferase [Caldilineales bacterium]MCW5859934.1 DegT/DnrJ/EryC1/StrS family aminotransferase [Caldilineales bacterium]
MTTLSDYIDIGMSSPDITAAERAAVMSVLESRFLSLGPKIVAFEQALAHYVGAAHAIAVNSGTSGLHLTVIAAGIGEGDLVITTPFSFVASSNVVLYERGVPIFVDVDPVTGNIDAARAAEAAADLCRGGRAADRWLPPALRNGRSGGRQGLLKAVLPVHAFGQPADMDAIMATAQAYGLTVIEDACESIGATYQGQETGVIGKAGVFAFYPNKQMTTGEGGIIVTNDDAWADLFRSLRNQGRDVFDSWLNHSRLGYNYRLDEMSAALGLVQVHRLDELLGKRAQVAAWYEERLADVEAIQTPTVAASTTRMSWFVYVVRVRPPASRNQVMTELEKVGIPSRPYFSPIHLQPFYRQRFGYEPGAFPITEELGQVSLALPFSGVMTEDEVDWVCGRLKKVVG